MIGERKPRWDTVVEWILQILYQTLHQKPKCQNKIFAFCQFIISAVKIIFFLAVLFNPRLGHNERVGDPHQRKIISFSLLLVAKDWNL